MTTTTEPEPVRSRRAPRQVSSRIPGLLAAEGPMIASEVARHLDCAPRAAGKAMRTLFERGAIELRGERTDLNPYKGGKPCLLYAAVGDSRERTPVPQLRQLALRITDLLAERGPLTGPEMHAILKPDTPLNSSVTESAKKLVRAGALEDRGLRRDLAVALNRQAPHLFAVAGDPRERPVLVRLPAPRKPRGPRRRRRAEPLRSLTERQAEIDAAVLRALDEMGERNLNGVQGRTMSRDKPSVMRSLERHIAAGRVVYRNSVHGTVYRLADHPTNPAYDESHGAITDASEKWRKYHNEKNADLRKALLGLLAAASPGALTMDAIVRAYEGDKTPDQVRDEVRRLWRGRELMRNPDGFRVGLRGKLSFETMNAAFGERDDAALGITEVEAVAA